MNLWTYTTRETRRRPGRTLLTLLGISLGLATVVATRLTVHTVHRAYHDLFEDVAGRTALEVMAPGAKGFDGSFAPSLRDVAGVQGVRAQIQGAASLVGQTGSVAVPVLGIEPQDAAGDWPVRDGRPLASAEDALLDPELAHGLALKPGDRFRLWAPGGAAELVLAGTLQPRGPAAAVGGVLIVPLASAQRLFDLPERVNTVQVLLADNANPGTVQAEIARRLPPGLSVQPPGTRSELARSTLLATEQGLASLSIVALTAAAFVILNTFLLNLGERRRQLAILRTLGATCTQIRRLLLREMLLLGLLGTLIGWVGGYLLAVLLLRAMGQFLGVGLPGLELRAEPFLLSGLLGPGTALAAAWLPAWSASRRPPLQELLPQRHQGCEGLPRRVCQAGLLLLFLGLVLEVGLCYSWFSMPLTHALIAPALGILLAGCVLLMPALGGPLLRLAALLPLGLEGRLAVEQLRRHRTRTGLSAGVLFLAVVVAIGFGHCLRGVLHDLQQWYRQTIVADFLVRGAMPDTTFMLAPALPAALAADLEKDENVAAVDRVAFIRALANNKPVLVLARTFTPGQPLPLDLREGEAAAVLAGLLRGEVVLGTAVAQRLELHPGDMLSLETGNGPRQLRVAGTVAEYAVGGSALYMEWETARGLLGLPGVHIFLINAKAGAADALAPKLQALCDRDHLLLQSNADLHGLIDRLVSRMAGVLWALMALAFVVGALGVVNTLTMNVHDQTRQFGVLRALGLKRDQLRKVVLAQALLLGWVGLLPGACVGVALAYLINRTTASLGPPVPFHLDGVVVVGCCGLALVIALLAALVPARQAARLPVVRALADA